MTERKREKEREREKREKRDWSRLIWNVNAEEEKKILALILWKGGRCIIAVSPLCDRLPEAFWRGRGDHGSGECRVWVRAM